jgi:Tfp pilus assembly PilM family ATPase
MNSAETRTSTIADIHCLACDANNDAKAKFCCKCGVSLWDQCPSCATPATKDQKFCGHCGHSLQDDIDQRRQQAQVGLSDAEDLLRKYDFDAAIAEARQWVVSGDPRFSEVSAKAESFIARAVEQKNHWESQLQCAEPQAESAFRTDNFDEVVRLLEPFPEIILGESLAKILRISRQTQSELATLSSRFRKAVEAKDFVVAGGVIEQICALRPDDESHRIMARKIGQVLIKAAEKRFAAGQYADSLARLDATPTVVRDDEAYKRLRVLIDNVSWLTDQVARAPYATPLLGRLVQRLGKMAPHDPRTPGLLQQLAVKIKAGSSDPMSLFPAWIGSAKGWSDAPCTILGRSQRIVIGDAKPPKMFPTQFFIAYGLALQGLGVADFSGTLASDGDKGGLKKLLRRRGESDAAWGVDAGNSALRAVKLVRQGEQIRVAEAYWFPHEVPLCRIGNELRAPVLLRKQLDDLASKLSSDDAPVWAGLPSRDVLGRFLSLPPLPDRQLNKLIDQEFENHFPVAADQLVCARKVAGNGVDGSRRTVLVAAKRSSVELREKQFEEAGIKLAGLQADPIALHNFVHYDLADQLTSQDSGSATPKTICVVDAGATGTTLYIARQDGFWFRFTDGGGEDLTSKLAAATHMTHAIAEGMKRNPAELSELAHGMEAIESRLAQNGVRLSQHFQQANQFLGENQLQRILCTGGSALTHGWLRFTFQASSKS